MSGAFSRSTPTISTDPLPRMAPARRRNLQASCGSKLPIVEPGKNPARGNAAISAGNSVSVVKSATTGMIDRCGKSRRSRAASSRRKSPEISTGTYASTLAAARSRMRALRLPAAAELDERRALRKQRGDLRRMFLQQADLAARRIIFGQLGDTIEQAGAGQIVKVFRRQIFGLGGKTGGDIGGELICRLSRVRRTKGGSRAHEWDLSVRIPKGAGR